MATANLKLRAWAQLLRLPNAFTAVADPLAGWLIAGGASPSLALIMAASACLYTGGIVLNDCFDFDEDRRERPERPLPSGHVPRSAAWLVGAILLLTGLVLAILADRALIGVALAAGILFYNAFAKHHAGLGVLTLAACRFGNLTLGLSQLHPAAFILAAYVAVLSLIARRETTKPGLQIIVRRLLLNLIVLDAVLVVVFTANWLGGATVLMLLVPAWALSRILKMT
jgi:4-hydroxybenzoate polyprenyltransferase